MAHHGEQKGNSEYTNDKLKREIYKCIVRGETRDSIVTKIMTDYWGLGNAGLKDKAIAEKYVAAVRKQMKKDWEEERKDLKPILVKSFQDIYNDCRNNNDRYNAISAMRELSKLSGMYEPDKIDLTMDGTIEINFNEAKEDIVCE